MIEQRDEFFRFLLNKAFVFVGRVLNCVVKQLPVAVKSVDFRLPPAALQDSHSQPEVLGDFLVICNGAVRIAVDPAQIGVPCGAVFVRHILNSAFTPTVRFLEIWEKVFRIFLLLRFHLQLDSQILKYLICRIPRHIGQFPIGNDFLNNRVHGDYRILHTDPALMIQHADILPVFQCQHFTKPIHRNAGSAKQRQHFQDRALGFRQCFCMKQAGNDLFYGILMQSIVPLITDLFRGNVGKTAVCGDSGGLADG